LGVTAAVVGRTIITPSKPAARPALEEKRGLVPFTDKAAGFDISIPASWRRLPGGGEVRLVAGRGSASILVRTASIGFRIGPENIRDARKLTDSLVRASRQAELLRQPKRTLLGGLPGYAYLYTFRDTSGRLGAHVHYFLFRDDTMITLVFQALPADRLTAVAPLFDRIADTFTARAPSRRG